MVQQVANSKRSMTDTPSSPPHAPAKRPALAAHSRTPSASASRALEPPAAQGTPAARTQRQPPTEEELFYKDKDHRYAHGHADVLLHDGADSSPWLAGLAAASRRRTATAMLSRLSESQLFASTTSISSSAGSAAVPRPAQAASLSPLSVSACMEPDTVSADQDVGNGLNGTMPFAAQDAAFAVVDPHDPALAATAAVGTVGPASVRHTSARHAPYSAESRPSRRRRGSHDDSSFKPRKFLINVDDTQRAILAQEDTDGDFQITIHDVGPKTFTLGTAASGGFNKFEVRGTYALSNLLQELALAADRLYENPVDRLHRLIKYHFWDALTRRIDADGLEKICEDPKNRSADQRNRIYVPFHDKQALEYYEGVAVQRPHLRLVVERLPEEITPEYVRSIDGVPGILSLALRQQRDPTTGEMVTRGAPFVVPGGRFNEMYGWDSYFEALGLLADGRVELGRGMVENFWYEIEHYGKILNANRSYYLTRSQPPFLTDMTVETHKKLREKIDWTADRCAAWLACGVRAAIKEHLSVWKASPRLDAKTGLSKYYTEGIRMPPETESTHFDHILAPYAMRLGMSIEEYTAKYNADEIVEPELDEYFVHDRAVRESGHDTTYRFEKRCANLATVDLNSLVFKYEKDIAALIDEHFGGMITLRVRRGPNNVHLDGFMEWRANLAARGSVNAAVGNYGGWNSSWAKGICVYDDEADGIARADHSQSQALDAMDTSVPVSVTENASAATGHGRAHADASTSTNDAAGSAANGTRVPMDSMLPEYDLPDSDNSPFFTVRISAALYASLADHTQGLITHYLWSPSDSMFFDWDCVQDERSVYETVTCLWTLWAGCATAEQAALMRPVALSKFEVVGGLVSGTEESRGAISLDRPNRQWDYPFGWAPHQIMAWAGLQRYGFEDDARRVCYRWLYTLTKSFVDFNGVVPEKFDVVNMTHKFHVEYGNVGADFRFVVREGFGWMNASYEVGLPYLTQSMRRALGTLTQPDQLFRALRIC
ncbi:trehalase-domain-containing protein [Entophlyctis helioformis]|nr:trehalase-domain-containing protein [Entophlyctis helioformis]